MIASFNNISPLGVVANSKRQINQGPEYNYFFAGATYTDPILHKTMDIDKTLEFMAKIVVEYNHETKKIADLLYNPDVYQFSKNIWHFVYQNIQYGPDKPNIEQLRSPKRTWADRHKGVDCDCMSIFISSILTNKNIPHYFRITKYGRGWQHVYVVVPHKGKEIIIDTVMDSFDSEKPYTEKKDFNPWTGKPLNGLGDISQLNQLSNTKTTVTMIDWIKANPVTTTAIGIIGIALGYVVFDQLKKKKKPLSGNKSGRKKLK